MKLIFNARSIQPRIKFPFGIPHCAPATHNRAVIKIECDYHPKSNQDRDKGVTVFWLFDYFVRPYDFLFQPFFITDLVIQ